MGSVKLFLFFTALIAASDGLRSPSLDNYNFSQVSECLSKVNVFMDRGVLVEYSGYTLSYLSGNRSPECGIFALPRSSGGGVIGVIQEMNLRESPPGCLDQVMIGENSPALCGEMLFGLKKSCEGSLTPPPEFISEYPGMFENASALLPELPDDPKGMDIRFEALKGGGGWVERVQMPIRTALKVSSAAAIPGKEMNIVISFILYKECDSGNETTGQFFNCGYGLCILKKFVNDGVVNCPFGDCRDEGGCQNALLTSSFLTEKGNWSPYPDGAVAVRPAMFLIFVLLSLYFAYIL